MLNIKLNLKSIGQKLESGQNRVENIIKVKKEKTSARNKSV